MTLPVIHMSILTEISSFVRSFVSSSYVLLLPEVRRMKKLRTPTQLLHPAYS